MSSPKSRIALIKRSVMHDRPRIIPPAGGMLAELPAGLQQCHECKSRNTAPASRKRTERHQQAALVRLSRDFFSEGGSPVTDITGIHHTGLHVRDIEASLAFY